MVAQAADAEPVAGEVGGEARLGQVRGGPRRSTARPRPPPMAAPCTGRDDRLPGAEDAHRVQIKTVDRTETVSGIALLGRGCLGRLLRMPRHGSLNRRPPRPCLAASTEARISMSLSNSSSASAIWLISEMSKKFARRPLDFDEADVAVLLDADICKSCHFMISKMNESLATKKVRPLSPTNSDLSELVF